MNINYLQRANNPDIKDIIIGQGFEQLIKNPTRITTNSKTLIDLILANKKCNISTTTVIPLSLSDHDLNDAWAFFKRTRMPILIAHRLLKNKSKGGNALGYLLISK